MNAPQQANPQFHYELNGRNSRPEDAALSQEVQECIQFFDDTIVSLEESLTDDYKRTAPRGRGPNGEVNRSNPHPRVPVSSVLTGPLSPNQDIIDLVRPGPDLVQTRQPVFNPTSPDFQSVAAHTESHLEVKPWRDQMDSLPSEYNPPLPSGSYGSTDSSYHPPGCIPTPVLIAQQMAENQAGGTSNLLRHRSFNSDKPPSPSSDPPGKHGPPTSAKPSRFPANISVILGNKEQQSQSLAAVHIHERRAQMLANLSGTSNPLLPVDPEPAAGQQAQNTPTRSTSFRDPTPSISRMEALSKLGLNRSRAMSGGPAQLPDSASLDRRAEVLRTPSLKSLEERSAQPSPSPPAVTRRSFSPSPYEHKASGAPPHEVTSNSYGGKSVVVNPSASKSEPVSSPSSPDPKGLPPALASPSEFNTYGGKTKVMNPATPAVTRSNLPDILSSHITKSPPAPPRSELQPIEANSYGGKSRTINASSGSTRPSEPPARSLKHPAPAPAPRAPPHSQKAPATHDQKRRPSSMFRPQGITVQFAGRGTSEESRKEALRKLGLM
ncbi:LOW QUALITY PROTEIN: proline and serine-rich protein 2 [Pleuronectes platessa]|uniref:LOW QUALITY PROTEIN: proline and serine-rich protein 2 n=1 Tax=Pleuronectes platessa TaxID=8262 RepID=UPI00232A3A2F|nr:LOW QUALITY PROTEIN: proline and serine-rich protein 2 [Pleuronectes platessa]